MSEAPERIWIDRGPRGGWITDLVQSQIDAAVAAAYEDAADIVKTFGIPRDEFDAHNGNPRPSLAQAIRARGDTDALAERDKRVRAEALREAAKTAEHFYEKGQVTKPSDILALIPEKEKDDE